MSGKPYKGAKFGYEQTISAEQSVAIQRLFVEMPYLGGSMVWPTNFGEFVQTNLERLQVSLQYVAEDQGQKEDRLDLYEKIAWAKAQEQAIIDDKLALLRAAKQQEWRADQGKVTLDVEVDAALYGLLISEAEDQDKTVAELIADILVRS